MGIDFVEGLPALLQVLWVDIVLAGDNAIVVGMAAQGVSADRRSQVIFYGIAAAVVLRIIFAVLTTQLLQIIGLALAGGVLLLWVSWKLFRETRERAKEDKAAESLDAMDGQSAGPPTKSMRQAVMQVVLADVSMSLDNVLAVAGAAEGRIWVLVVGLFLSVVFMGAAATVIARILTRYHWIAYVGLAVIAFIAIKLIIEGSEQILHALPA